MAVNSMVVRGALGVESFNELWQSLRTGAEGGVGCPGCAQRMNATWVGGVKLEGCPVCTLIWFEAGERETTLKDVGSVDDPTRKLTEEEMRRAPPGCRSAPRTGGTHRHGRTGPRSV